MNILCIKSWDGYGFYCMLKQAEIDVQLTSNRKLPNFYEKVTDFLLESYRISKWWQNHVFTETCCICHKWRILTYWMMRLFMQMDWIFMQKTDWTHRICQQSSVFIVFVNTPLDILSLHFPDEPFLKLLEYYKSPVFWWVLTNVFQSEWTGFWAKHRCVGRIKPADDV